MGILKSAADFVYTIRFLKLLTTPFEKMGAYEIGLIDKDDKALYGGKMIEKFTQNKFNSWRAKYYSQNWGPVDVNNPPFIFGCNSIQKKDI